MLTTDQAPWLTWFDFTLCNITLLVFSLFWKPSFGPSVESELTPEIGHLFWVRQIRSCQHRNWQAWSDFKIKWLFSTTFPTSVHQKIYSVMANHWLVVGRCWNGFSIMAADLIRRPEQTGVGNIDLTYRQLVKISGEKKISGQTGIGERKHWSHISPADQNIRSHKNEVQIKYWPHILSAELQISNIT